MSLIFVKCADCETETCLEFLHPYYGLCCGCYLQKELEQWEAISDVLATEGETPEALEVRAHLSKMKGQGLAFSAQKIQQARKEFGVL